MGELPLLRTGCGGRMSVSLGRRRGDACQEGLHGGTGVVAWNTGDVARPAQRAYLRPYDTRPMREACLSSGRWSGQTPVIMSRDTPSTITGEGEDARRNRRMNIVHLHEQALDETARLVDGVRPDQMGLPTPCSDWDVRALLAHLVGGNARYAALARGEPLRRGPAQGGGPAADLLGDDPADAYRRSAARRGRTRRCSTNRLSCPSASCLGARRSLCTWWRR